MLKVRIGKFGAHREPIGILLFVVDQFVMILLLISFVLVKFYSRLCLHQPFSCQILSTTYLSNKVNLLTILILNNGDLKFVRDILLTSSTLTQFRELVLV